MHLSCENLIFKSKLYVVKIFPPNYSLSQRLSVSPSAWIRHLHIPKRTCVHYAWSWKIKDRGIGSTSWFSPIPWDFQDMRLFSMIFLLVITIGINTWRKEPYNTLVTTLIDAFHLTFFNQNLEPNTHKNNT
jgi:hypothetical protein